VYAKLLEWCDLKVDYAVIFPLLCMFVTRCRDRWKIYTCAL